MLVKQGEIGFSFVKVCLLRCVKNTPAYFPGTNTLVFSASFGRNTLDITMGFFGPCIFNEKKYAAFFLHIAVNRPLKKNCVFSRTLFSLVLNTEFSCHGIGCYLRFYTVRINSSRLINVFLHIKQAAYLCLTIMHLYLCAVLILEYYSKQKLAF